MTTTATATTAKSIHRAPGERGNTLIGVLIGIAILGVITALLGSVSDFNAKTLADVERRADFEDARRWLSATTNCAQTKALMGGACPGPTVDVAVSGAKGVLLPAATPYRVVGKYELRARCTTTTPMTIDVQIHKTGSSEAWQPLFKKLPIQC